MLDVPIGVPGGEDPEPMPVTLKAWLSKEACHTRKGVISKPAKGR